ncbi:MAG: hypothetical protein ABS93_00530 [Thiobacillus sp. SCN 62-729]|nr:MAG: hypothetical protein ABS93_00530 [Thiobacillus sp. SCN 62-729]
MPRTFFDVGRPQGGNIFTKNQFKAAIIFFSDRQPILSCGFIIFSNIRMIGDSTAFQRDSAPYDAFTTTK